MQYQGFFIPEVNYPTQGFNLADVMKSALSTYGNVLNLQKQQEQMDLARQQMELAKQREERQQQLLGNQLNYYQTQQEIANSTLDEKKKKIEDRRKAKELLARYVSQKPIQTLDDIKELYSTFAQNNIDPVIANTFVKPYSSILGEKEKKSLMDIQKEYYKSGVAQRRAYAKYYSQKGQTGQSTQQMPFLDAIDDSSIDQLKNIIETDVGTPTTRTQAYSQINAIRRMKFSPQYIKNLKEQLKKDPEFGLNFIMTSKAFPIPQTVVDDKGKKHIAISYLGDAIQNDIPSQEGLNLWLMKINKTFWGKNKLSDINDFYKLPKNEKVKIRNWVKQTIDKDKALLKVELRRKGFTEDVINNILQQFDKKNVYNVFKTNPNLGQPSILGQAIKFVAPGAYYSWKTQQIQSELD